MCVLERACSSVCLPIVPVNDLPPPNFPDLVNTCLHVFVCGSDRVLHSHAVLSRL